MTFSTEKPDWAKELCDIQIAHNEAESQAFDKFIELFGLNPESVHDLTHAPFGDVTYDWYDMSFELKGANDGLELTEQQQAKCKEWGFLRCWICYKSGKEQYYSFS